MSYLHLLCCIVSCDNSSLYPCPPSRNCVLKMDGLYQKLFCRKIPESISRAIFKLYELVTICFHENIIPNFHEFLKPLSCFDKKQWQIIKRDSFWSIKNVVEIQNSEFVFRENMWWSASWVVAKHISQLVLRACFFSVLLNVWHHNL